MGDRPHTLRSSGLRLLLRLLSVVAALCVLLVSSRASAAVRVAVPMCGERNESIAAPPIFRAHDSGTISAGPCQSDELRLGKSAPIAPERYVVPDKPERVLSFTALGISRGDGSLLFVDFAADVSELPGHPGLVFRPPRG